jgi:hypothetical protein
LRTWLTQGAKHSIFLKSVKNRGVFRDFYARFFVLYCDLLAFSVEIALALACTWGHAHNWLFESSALIGQSFEFLARDFPKTSYTEYNIAHLILSSLPYYLLLMWGIGSRGNILSALTQFFAKSDWFVVFMSSFGAYISTYTCMPIFVLTVTTQPVTLPVAQCIWHAG